MIPTLETERLILRPHRLADFDAYVEMWADPDVVRFIGGKPFDRESSGRGSCAISASGSSWASASSPSRRRRPAISSARRGSTI
jgi:RimJ/RimL family protein N-acetyltransferase